MYVLIQLYDKSYCTFQEQIDEILSKINGETLDDWAKKHDSDLRNEKKIVRPFLIGELPMTSAKAEILTNVITSNLVKFENVPWNSQ